MAIRSFTNTLSIPFYNFWKNVSAFDFTNARASSKPQIVTLSIPHPGFAKDDIRIFLRGNILIMEGFDKKSRNQKQETFRSFHELNDGCHLILNGIEYLDKEVRIKLVK